MQTSPFKQTFAAAPASKEHYKKKLQSLSQDRQPYFNLWRELSDYIRPDRGRFLSQSDKKAPLISKKILDSTATLAVRTLASGMMAGISSPAQSWFKLEPAEKSLQTDQNVLEWIKEIEKSMMDVFARTNLYNALHTLYSELVVFGTAALIIDTDAQDVLRAYPLTAGEYFLATNSKQEVDTLYREFKLTVTQAAERFGAENLSQDVQHKLKDGKADAVIAFVHVIEPNPAYKADAKDPFTKAYRSIIFEKDSDDTEVYAHIGGYDEFPVMCPRWSLTGSEVYGYSPGMEALPDIKQLQHEQRKKAQAIDKKVSPPLQAPTSMKHSAVNGLPGGVSFYDETRQQSGIRPTYEVNLPLSELQKDIEDVQKRIERIFYADLFMMLAHKGSKTMTAREVEERHEEKMLMLGPVLERLHNELLDPLIKRCFAIMKRGGILPPPPIGYEDVEIKVEYVSMMAQAQRSTDLIKIERLIEFIGKIQALAPSQAVGIEASAMLYRAAQLIGVNADLIKTEPQALFPQAENFNDVDWQNALAGLEALSASALPLTTPKNTVAEGGQNERNA